jgi:membrane protein implicated in regulation of membrane protease activity
MSAIVDTFGVIVVLGGIVLLAAEFAHPGALLLIPGSILIVGGLLSLFLPDVLFNSPYGILVIVAAAILATVVEVPYYRWIAPTHGPMTTTSAGLTGEIGTVIAPVIPNTLRGKIKVKSEVWSADADRAIPIGTRVRVVSGEGVVVKVVPVGDGASAQ